MEKKAGRAILTRSIYRWESAVIIALTLGLALLSLAGVIPALFGVFQWWFWLILGALGEAGLVWSSVKDPEFRAKAVGEMFREKFDAREIEDEELRKRVEKALEYRDRIDEVIAKSKAGIMREHMTDVSQGITHWMESVFRLARRLDAYEGDETLREDLKAVKPALEKLYKDLDQWKDDTSVSQQISQAIAQKQILRDNLHKLQKVMERGQFQLESTITAMGTVYSQMLLLGSRDIASGRAQRLQRDVDDQVQALQDVVQTMDEVYQTGTDPLGLGLTEKEIAAASAIGAGQQPARKRLGSN